MSKFDADLIIIGAGPAGLTAAQYGARANLKVLVIEELAPGGQALLIDALENYPGNIPPKSGYDFSQDLHRQAEEFGAIFLSASVASIKKSPSPEHGGGIFLVEFSGGETRSAAAVIIATGATHRLLDIPGEKEFTGRGVSYCATCDGAFFKNKKVFVVGGGDAACDEARYLSRLTNQVVMIHRRDSFRAQKALVKRTLENPNIEVRLNTIIKEIKGAYAGATGVSPIAQKVASVILEDTKSGTAYEEAADAVFIFVGTIPRSALIAASDNFNTASIIDENGYIITNQNMATNIPGLFAAGDVRSGSFKQVVVAAGEGAVAAHSAAEYVDKLIG